MYPAPTQLTPAAGDHPRHALARLWRSLFAARDEPADDSPIRVRVATALASPSAAAPHSDHSDDAANADDDDSTLRDLAPAPLYFGYDDAESALVRLLEASAASARDAAARQ